MARRTTNMFPAAGFLLAVCFLTTAVSGQDELGKRASWQQPSPAEVKDHMLRWLESQELDDATKLQFQVLWPDDGLAESHVELLEQVAITISLIEPDAAAILGLCRAEPPALLPVPSELLVDETVDPFVRNNLRLYYGAWLAQYAYYDEALEVLTGLSEADVVDPASLLFYQSVANHRLLQKDACLETLTRLLDNEAEIPRRYLAVAQLMEADIKPLKEDSLDEVARLMDDIRRRLVLGRAGTRVREEEDEVIEKLDKMIEELEKQQQQQQANANSAGNNAPINPAEDSVPLGGSGAGDVDPKRKKNESAWGNLPPKERQEALQQISKDLPAHFREVIEEYFRKLARDGGN